MKEMSKHFEAVSPSFFSHIFKHLLILHLHFPTASLQSVSFSKATPSFCLAEQEAFPGSVCSKFCCVVSKRSMTLVFEDGMPKGEQKTNAQRDGSGGGITELHGHDLSLSACSVICLFMAGAIGTNSQHYYQPFPHLSVPHLNFPRKLCPQEKRSWTIL